MTELSVKNSIRNAMLMAVLALMVIAAPAIGISWAAKGDLEPVGVPEVVHAPFTLTLGKADLIDVEGAVADVLVADPSLIDVMAIQSNRLYIVGLQVGDTNIIALDEMGNIVKRLDVHVSYDLQAIQALVNELFPDEAVQVRSIHDQILLTGKVSSASQAARISNVVASYVGDLTDQSGTTDELISNLLEVRGEQQVMLQVRIVEAARNVLRELGLETSINNPVTSADDGTDYLTLSSDIALSEDAMGVLGLNADTGIRGIGEIGAVLQALERESLVNILAEPNLTAVSGEQAGFLAGGEFPVPVGRDNVGNIVIEFREFGVSLNFRPTVLSSDRISLQMNTEVSSLDNENAIVLDGLNIPGLDVRRADTTVEIGSGNSLMIAGLLQSEATKGLSGLPGISKTPVLGDLVSSHSFQRNETELIVIVTPYLVEPYAEKVRAQKAPLQKKKPLEHAFSNSLHRIYKFDEQEIIDSSEPYGYLLD